MISSLDRWLDMADGKLKGGEIPCLLNGGNDDIFEIDDVIDSSPNVTFGEGRLIDLGGFHLVSMGWTNPTPWNTFREAPEEELAARIEAVTSLVPDMERAIFNFHAPPYGTRPGRGARARRQPAPHARRRGHEAGRLDGGPGCNRSPSAHAFRARTHPREQGNQEDGPDPRHEPGQRLW